MNSIVRCACGIGIIMLFCTLALLCRYKFIEHKAKKKSKVLVAFNFDLLEDGSRVRQSVICTKSVEGIQPVINCHKHLSIVS